MHKWILMSNTTNNYMRCQLEHIASLKCQNMEKPKVSKPNYTCN